MTDDRLTQLNEGANLSPSLREGAVAEREVAGHIVSVVRMEGKTDVFASSISFNFLSETRLGRVPPAFRVGLSTSSFLDVPRDV